MSDYSQNVEAEFAAIIIVTAITVVATIGILWAFVFVLTGVFQ